MTRGRIAGIGALIALAVIIVIGLASIYVVDPRQNAIVLRFGQPVEVTDEPGLYFKLPLVDNVVYLERRLLDINSPAVEFANQDGRLVVDAFGRYRIVNPLQFYTSTSNGSIAVANSRLADILSSTVRNVLAPSTFQSIVAQDRSVLMQQITSQVNAQAAEIGVEVVDVRIRRADLPSQISESVFTRMRTLWQTQAAQVRAEGEEQARSIRAVADATVTRTIALANQQAETIRGDGDAQANTIFAAAYGIDPDFFSFYRSMLAYQQGFTANTTTMVLDPTTDFFRFFGQFGVVGNETPTIVLPDVAVPEIPVPDGEIPIVPMEPLAPFDPAQGPLDPLLTPLDPGLLPLDPAPANPAPAPADPAAAPAADPAPATPAPAAP